MDSQKEESDWIRRLKQHMKDHPKVARIDIAEELLNEELDTTSDIMRGRMYRRKRPVMGFKDLAGMEELKQFVTESFINVLNNPECAEAFGIVPPSMLFYGPPGNGKTAFVEAMSHEVGIKFRKVTPDDIACMWVHGTQEKIAEIFRQAEKEAPVIIFLDEFDAMVPRRTADDSSHQNGEVNQFLCNLNNAAEKGVFVVCATNHPEVIDKAILRTGRIDEILYIGMPDTATRESLFRLSLSKVPSAEDIDYKKLAELAKGYNCSDISYIVKVASRKMFNASIAEKGASYKLITQKHLEEAIAHKAPSVSSHDLREYEQMRLEFSPKDASAQRQRLGFTY